MSVAAHVLRRSALPALPLLAGLALAAPAHAGTIFVETDHQDGDPREGFIPPRVVLQAGAGERNDVRLMLGADGSVVARDRGAALQPGAGCATAADGAVACTVSAPRRIIVGLGDEDDRFALEDHRRQAVGPEHGQVEVTGDDGDDRLTGGARADVLGGGPGRDVLRGGRGDDRLDVTEAPTGYAVQGASRPPARPDVVDGGPGVDVVDYSGQRQAVSATLTTPQGGGVRGGARRLRDRFRSVEGLDGTSGADVLTGSPGADSLVGEGGVDLLRGRAGRDSLSGSGTLDGGPGDDVLALGSALAPPSEARCGPGADAVTDSRDGDLLLADCEERRLSTTVRASIRPRRTADGALALDVTCDQYSVGDMLGGCPPGARLDVALTTPPADDAWQDRGPFALRVAAGSSVVPATGPLAGPQPLRLAPTPEGVRLLAGRSRQLVRVTTTAQIGRFSTNGPAWTVALPAPRR